MLKFLKKLKLYKILVPRQHIKYSQQNLFAVFVSIIYHFYHFFPIIKKNILVKWNILLKE